MRGAATRVRSGADAPADARTSGAAPVRTGTRASGRWMRAGAPARAASRWRRSALLWAREGRSRSVRAQRRAFERTSRADAERGPGAPPDGARAGAPTGPHAPRARHGPIGRGGGCSSAGAAKRRAGASSAGARTRPPDPRAEREDRARRAPCAGRAEPRGRAGAWDDRRVRRVDGRRRLVGVFGRLRFERALPDRRAVRLRGERRTLLRRPGLPQPVAPHRRPPPSARSGVRRRGPPSGPRAARPRPPEKRRRRADRPRRLP